MVKFYRASPKEGLSRHATPGTLHLAPNLSSVLWWADVVSKTQEEESKPFFIQEFDVPDDDEFHVFNDSWKDEYVGLLLAKNIAKMNFLKQSAQLSTPEKRTYSCRIIATGVRESIDWIKPEYIQGMIVAYTKKFMDLIMAYVVDDLADIHYYPDISKAYDSIYRCISSGIDYYLDSAYNASSVFDDDIFDEYLYGIIETRDKIPKLRHQQTRKKLHDILEILIRLSEDMIYSIEKVFDV